jgi:hypothetical protein
VAEFYPIEVNGLVQLFVFLFQRTCRSLFLLKLIFPFSSQLQISVFQRSLIWPSSTVSRRYHLLEFFWEIVKLKSKLAHEVVHPEAWKLR